MSLKSDIYTGVKDLLEGLGFDKSDGGSDTIKTVALWRNQVERENEEIPFLCPAVFIEFLPAQYMESSSKVYQEVRMNMRLHLVFESYKTEDLDVLAFDSAVFSTIQGTQFGYSGKLKRRDDVQSFDHGNLQVLTQDYDCGMGKDYGADARPSTPATINTITITPEITNDL